MASLTIDDLDDDVMRRLEARAKEHGRSPADEVRVLIAGVTGAGHATAAAAASGEKIDKVRHAVQKIKSGQGVSDLGDALGEPALRGLPVRAPADQMRVYEALTALRVGPSAEPFDQKAFTDDLWSFVE